MTGLTHYASHVPWSVQCGLAVSLVLSAKTCSGLHNVTYSCTVLNASDNTQLFSCCLAWPFSALCWPHRFHSLNLSLFPLLSHLASLEGSWDFRVQARSTALSPRSRNHLSPKRSAFASGLSIRSRTRRRRSQRTLAIAMGHRSQATGLRRSQ